MKNIFFMLALLATLAGAACQQTTAPEEQNTETTPAAADASPQLAYMCPMGCEGSASSTAGKCPVCDMQLHKNPDHAAADSAAQKTP
jgi:hypothetical protein